MFAQWAQLFSSLEPFLSNNWSNVQHRPARPPRMQEKQPECIDGLQPEKTEEKPLTPSYGQYLPSKTWQQLMFNDTSGHQINDLLMFLYTSRQQMNCNQPTTIRHQPLVSNQRHKYSTNTSLFGHGCFQASCRACHGKCPDKNFGVGPGHGAQVAATASDVRWPICVGLLSPDGEKADW